MVVLVFSVFTVNQLPIATSQSVVSETDSEPHVVLQEYFGYGTSISTILQTADGGFLAVGKGWSYQMWYNDPVLFKFDSTGDMQWNKSIPVTGPAGVLQTSDGGYVLACNVLKYHPGTGDYDYRNASLVKLDAKGNLVWNQTYSVNRFLSSMAATSDGGFLLTYNTQNPYNINMTSQAVLLKTDSSGNLEWNNTYGANGSINLINAAIQASDGGYVFVGSTSFNGVGSSPDQYFWVAKADNNGELLWSHSYGEGSGVLNTDRSQNSNVDSGLNRDVFGDNYAYSLVEASDGGYVFLGTRYNQNNEGVTVLAKVDSFGDMVWLREFNGSPNSPITLLCPIYLSKQARASLLLLVKT